MLHSNGGLFSESGSWDSSCARKFLRIPEDQLEIIKKIPGWSKTEICKKSANPEKQLSEQASKSAEHFLTTNVSAKDSNKIKNLSYNSDLQSKLNFSSSSKTKNTSASPLQRSSSFPDLREQLPVSDILPHSKSEEILKKRVSYAEKAASDGTNQNKISQIRSLESCPVEHPNQPLTQRIFEKLDDNILNHKYLKDFNSTPSVKSDALPSFSSQNIRSAGKQEMSSFEKKLLLLEKRFSPCKESGPPLCSEKLKNVDRLNLEKSSLNPMPVDKGLKSRVNHDLIENVPEKTKIPLIPKSTESQANSELLNKMAKSAPESTKGHTRVAISNTPSNDFDASYLSQPVPCGQSLPAEVPSMSQVNPAQKPAEINLPAEPQNVKIIASEKPSATFSVFSANSNEKVSGEASVKEFSNKRKRKSKSEKSSKKLDAKKLKRIDIQFSPAQIKSMVEILKILNTDV